MISRLANRVLAFVDVQVVHKSSLDSLEQELRHLTAQIRDIKETIPPGELAKIPSLAEREAAARGRNGYCYFGNHVGIARIDNGHKIFVDTRDREITPHIVLFGKWERSREQVVVGFCRPGSTVIEVGANIGFRTIAIAAALGPQGRLHSFEANPDVFALLDLTVSINGYRDRVSLYPKVASDSERELELVPVPAEIGGRRVGRPGEHAPGETISIKAEAVRLDKELEGRVSKVDVLRIASDGTEPFILRGAREILRRSPDIKVIMTWDRERTSPVDLSALLSEVNMEGFRFWKIESDRALTEVAIEDMMNLTSHDVIMARHDPTAELR